MCPTPIGNLEDVTLRVLAALRDADVVACEDTRRTRVLLDRYGVRAKLVSYHEHNERARSAELVARMREGETVALVSDAGMPLVSDPGFVLVRACVAAGLAVEVLPGPSAVLAALVASGLPSAHWRFAGFLPRRRGRWRSCSPRPRRSWRSRPPRASRHRWPCSQSSIRAERPVAVCRELTKLHEEVVRGSAGELAERFAAQAPRGEVVLVIGGASGSQRDAEVANSAVRRLVEAGARPRPAAAVVAELTGVAANALYRSLTENPD